MQQAVFVNSDSAPIKVEHVCYYTSTTSEDMVLHEVAYETYPHPDAPGAATVRLMTSRELYSFRMGSERAAQLELMSYNQVSMRNYVKVLNGK